MCFSHVASISRLQGSCCALAGPPSEAALAAHCSILAHISASMHLLCGLPVEPAKALSVHIGQPGIALWQESVRLTVCYL